MNKILKEALSLQKENISVMPVGKNKRPLISWKDYQNKIATPDEIKKWWSTYPDAQLGIVTGKISNLAVLDVEKEYGDPRSLNLPLTTIIKTGSGGYHYYFKHNALLNNRAKINNQPIDIRAEGGYVIAPPSSNENGSYSYEQRATEWPDFPMSHPILKEKRQEEQHHTPSYDMDSFSGTSPGNRNDTMARHIGSVLAKTHPSVHESIAWPIIKRDNNKNSPPLPEFELRQTFNSIKERESSNSPDRWDKKKKDGAPVSFKTHPVSELMDKETPNFPYLVDKLVPKKAITSITADSGKGKSLISWIISKHVSTGEQLFDFKTEQGRVLIVDQEMDEDLIIDRIKTMMEKSDDIIFMYQQFWMINREEHFKWMVNYIKEQDIKLIILDTLTNIHDKEENSASEMREVNKLLLKLITDTGVTIVYLHHHKKQVKGEQRGQASSRGSTEIIAKVASHLLIDTKEKMEDENRILEIAISQEKARRPDGINKIAIKVIHNNLTKKTTWEYMGEIDDKKNKAGLAERFIMEVFSMHPGSEWTVKDFEEFKRDNPDNSFGERAMRDALRDMAFKDMLIVTKSKNSKLYKINEKKLQENSPDVETGVRESESRQGTFVDNPVE